MNPNHKGIYTEFKLAVLVFKALHGLAPSQYLADDCQLVTAAGRRELYDRQTPSRASSNAPILVLAIDHSQSLDHVCRTVFLLNFVIPSFPSDSFISRQRCICF